MSWRLLSLTQQAERSRATKADLRPLLSQNSTFKGQASIISSIFSGTGPSAMVTLTKPSVSIDVSFDTTTWSLWTLISTMGFTSAFNGLNEPRIMSKLQQVAVLKSISGTICTASQPEGSECVSSLKMWAYLNLGRGSMINDGAP